MTKRVTHLITGLGMGGAEMMLWQVLKYGDTAAADLRVISLSGEGESQYYVEQIRALGISVTAVPLKRRPVSSVLRICKLLRKTDTLFCWMYHSNFLGYILGRMCHVKRIVWNICHNDLSEANNKKLTLWINRFCAAHSARVDCIAYNGESSRRIHEDAGYARQKGTVLPNGCDCTRFCPDPEAAPSLHRELGIPDGRRIVLSVGRNHPIKDLPTFIRAFSIVHQHHPESTAVMCGTGITPEDADLQALCRACELQIGSDLYLIGQRTDVPRLQAACDLYVLHSAAEAFPNVLLQAMACGCLCVSTDVGPARELLGNDAQIVPPGDPAALAGAMEQMLTLSQENAQLLRDQARKTVLEHYSIGEVARIYTALYEQEGCSHDRT